MAFAGFLMCEVLMGPSWTRTMSKASATRVCTTPSAFVVGKVEVAAVAPCIDSPYVVVSFICFRCISKGFPQCMLR